MIPLSWYLIFAAALYRNSIFVVNPQTGAVTEEWKSGPRPYRLLFHPDGKSYFVTSWADGHLYQHDAATGGLRFEAMLATLRGLPAGRFVLLHDPEGQEPWDGEFRVVTFARGTVELDIAGDPMLTEVAQHDAIGQLIAGEVAGDA